MIKFIGLLFVFLCFAMSGHLLARREKERIDAAEGMLYLIRSIRQNVAFYKTPLNEIYKRFSHPSLQNGQFLPILNQKGLKNAYLSEKERFAYDTFTENRFLNFAEHIGKLPLEEQVKSCDMICDVLEEKLHEAKNKFPTQKKLYLVLSISLGISVVILFL